MRLTEVNKTAVTLTWNPPTSDNGSPITKYLIEKADAGRRHFASVGESEATTLTYKVTGLFEGSEYMFRVIAVNAIGESEPAALPESVTAKLPFG